MKKFWKAVKICSPFLITSALIKWTAKHSPGLLNANVIAAAKNYNFPAVRKNDLNIPPPADGNAILRMEIELRDKNVPAKKKGKAKGAMDLNVHSVDVSMEKVCWLQSLSVSPHKRFKNRFSTTCWKNWSSSMLCGTPIKPEIITKLYFPSQVENRVRPPCTGNALHLFLKFHK